MKIPSFPSPRAFATLAALAAAFAIPLASIAMQNGGLAVSIEGAALMGAFLDARANLASMVFDPMAHDWGLYQARELSYLFDFLDVRFIALCSKAGYPHFLSISFYACLALSILAINLVWRRLFDGLSRFQLLLGSFVLLCSPFVFWSGSFFRSSKPLCLLGLCVILPALYSIYVKAVEASRDRGLRHFALELAAVAFSALLMILADRQGFFFCLGLCVGSGLACLWFAFSLKESFRPSEPWRFAPLEALASLLLLAVLSGVAYNRFLGPFLIERFNGYFPSFAYQGMDASAAFNFGGGLRFLLEAMGVLACDSGIAGGAALALLTALGLASPLLSGGSSSSWRERFSSASGRASLAASLAYFFAMGLLLLMSNIMVARHPAILWPDVLRSLYFAPGAAICLFFLLLACDKAAKVLRGSPKAKLISAFLALLALGDCFVLPRSLELIRNGHMAADIVFTAETLQALREPGKASFRTAPFPRVYSRLAEDLSPSRGDGKD